MTARRADSLVPREGAEQERLGLDARAWEPEAERLLDRIGVPAGARCADLGCGPIGILAPLSRRAGPSGSVLGLDADPGRVALARAYAEREGLGNVRIMQGDPRDTGLPRESFDLVHARFSLVPADRSAGPVQELVSLVRPGGVVAVEEPDASSWVCFPENDAFAALREAILAGFARAGQDFNAGRRIFGLLQEGGLQDVQVRAALLSFQNRHPYMRIPLLLAESLRDHILDGEILSPSALRSAMAEFERFLRRPGSCMVTFSVMQAWGRKALR